MGTSDRTFEQVKSILGKLDRNIDQARARRLQDVPVGAVNGSHKSGVHGSGFQSPTAVLDQPVGTRGVPNNPVPGVGVAKPMGTPVAPAPSKSGYGRAQPLRRPGGTAM